MKIKTAGVLPRPFLLAGLFCSRQDGFVVRFVSHFFHHLYVCNDSFSINDENTTSEKAQFLNQNSVPLSKRSIFVVGKSLDFIDATSTTPAFLCEG